MRCGVVLFPGSNCDHDVYHVLKHVLEQEVTFLWHEERSRDEFPWRTLGTSVLPRRYLDWAVSEWRPERMSWLWMQPVKAWPEA